MGRLPMLYLLKRVALVLPSFALGLLLKALPRVLKTSAQKTEHILSAINQAAHQLGLAVDEGALVSQLHRYPVRGAELVTVSLDMIQHPDMRDSFREFFFVKARQLTIESGRPVSPADVMLNGLLLSATMVSHYYPKISEVLSDDKTREEWLRILLAAYGIDIKGENSETSAERLRDLDTLDRHIKASFQEGRAEVGRQMEALEKDLRVQVKEEQKRVKQLERELSAERSRASSPSPSRSGGE